MSSFLIRALAAIAILACGVPTFPEGPARRNSVQIERIAGLPNDCRDGCSLQMVDPGAGWLFSRVDCLLWATSDGGATWRLVPTPHLRRPDTARWWFVNRLQGWMLASSRQLYGTSDGGAHWTSVPPPKFDGLIEAAWVLPEQNIAWVAGGIYRTSSGPDAPNYAIKRSPEGSWAILHPIVYSEASEGTWTEHDLPTCAWSILSLKFWDERQGYAVGDSGCFFYTDTGGHQWALGKFHRSASSPNDPQGQPAATFFLDRNNGWTSFDDQGGSLYRTPNAGRDWYLVTTGIPHFDVLQFANKSRGLAVAQQSKLYQSVDAGATWSRVMTEFLPRSLYLLDERHGWVISDSGLYRVSLD